MRFGATRSFGSYAEAEQACADALACTCDSPTPINPFFLDVADQISAGLPGIVNQLKSFMHTFPQGQSCAPAWDAVDATTIGSEDQLFSALEGIVSPTCVQTDLAATVSTFLSQGAEFPSLHVCNHDHLVEVDAFQSGQCSDARRQSLCTNPVLAVPQLLNDIAPNSSPMVDPQRLQSFIIDVGARLLSSH
jgi:hypothetical protein